MARNAYDEFLARTVEAASARRMPVNGSIELTFRCNLNCVMCYNNLPGGGSGRTDVASVSGNAAARSSACDAK